MKHLRSLTAVAEVARIGSIRRAAERLARADGAQRVEEARRLGSTRVRLELDKKTGQVTVSI